MDFLIDNWEQIAIALASLWALISVVVGLTPSTSDDRALRRVAEIISLLKPSAKLDLVDVERVEIGEEE